MARTTSPRSTLSALVVVLPLLACSGADEPRAGAPDGFVIAGATVVDGTGAPGRLLNVRVSGDRITQVGDFVPDPADIVIDAEALVLAPGFIDTHSHHDRGLHEMPDALAAVSQGITTIIAGQDDGRPRFDPTETDFASKAEALAAAGAVGVIFVQGPRRLSGARVMATETPAPACTSWLTSAAVLYAAIPPLTPIRRRRPFIRRSDRDPAARVTLRTHR